VFKSTKLISSRMTPLTARVAISAPNQFGINNLTLLAGLLLKEAQGDCKENMVGGDYQHDALSGALSLNSNNDSRE
jgi:hypothetical protein